MTIQCSTEHYSTLQYSTVQHSAVHNNRVQYSTVQYKSLQYPFSISQGHLGQCLGLKMGTLHCTVYIALDWTAIHCISVCWCALYCIIQSMKMGWRAKNFFAKLLGNQYSKWAGCHAFQDYRACLAKINWIEYTKEYYLKFILRIFVCSNSIQLSKFVFQLIYNSSLFAVLKQ